MSQSINFNDQTAHLLVGCGGSGLAVLRRVLDLVAEDPVWSRQAGRHLAILAIDTDVGDLKEFGQHADRRLAQLPGEGPLLLTRAISANVDRIEPVVRQLVSPILTRDDAVEDRLRRHWFVRGDDEPLLLPRIINVTKGAGQCPPVSYLLAWRLLPQLGEDVDRLLSDLANRRAGASSADPLSNLQVHVVAGLAGGTGRGSWELVTGKIVERLAAAGRRPKVHGYFFDASAFEAVQETGRAETIAHQTRLNALTGLSQLSAWLGNVHRQAGRVAYDLPDLRSPADTILRLDGADSAGSSPIDFAVLIGGGNGSVTLDEPRDYQQMLAAGIYAAMTHHSIDARAINNYRPFSSLAAATLEVERSTLDSYFRHEARVRVLRRLKDESADARADAGGRFADFVRRHGVGLTAGGSTRLEAIPEAGGGGAGGRQNLLQRLLADARDGLRDQVAGFAAALREQDLEAAKAMAASLQRPDASSIGALVERVAGALRRSLPAVDAAALAEAASLFDRHASLLACRGFLNEVVEKLAEGERLLKSQRTLAPAADGRTLEGDVDAAAGRTFWVVGERFTEDEVADLTAAAQTAVAAAAYPAASDALVEMLSGWRATLESAVERLNLLENAGERQVRHFYDQMAGELGLSGSAEEKALDRVFVPRDRPERGLPHVFDRERFFFRGLRPVADEALLSRLFAAVETPPEVTSLVREVLADAALDPRVREAKDRVARLLQNAVDRHTRLPSNFLQKNFGIQGVLRDLHQAWADRFDAAQEHELEGLIQRFEAFFNCRPTGRPGELAMPAPEEMLLATAASLAVTCRPFWRVRDGDLDARHVSVFLPAWDGLDEGRVDAYLDGRLPSRVVAQTYRGGADANPFVLMVYAVDGLDFGPDGSPHPLDRVQTFDYWRDDPVVKAWLARAEAPVERNLAWHQTGTNGGLGFHSPLYLTPELAALRWRPWHDEGADLVDEIDLLLLYALLRPAGDAAAALAKVDWPLPLIVEGSGKSYGFARGGLRWDGARGAPQPFDTIEAGAALGKGIWNVAAFLGRDVQEMPSRERARAADYCSRIRAEALDFWTQVLPSRGLGPDTANWRPLLDAAVAQFDAAFAADTDSGRPTWRRLGELAAQVRDGRVNLAAQLAPPPATVA